MRQLLTLTVLLLGAAWAAAQSYPSQTSPSTSSNSSASSNSGQTSSQTSSGTQPMAGDTGSQTTVVGCLDSSNGNYTLTSSNGKTYQLAGDTGQLKDHVGHKVQIKGNVLSASSFSSAGSGVSPDSSGTTSSNQSSLSVSSIKHMSKTCNNKQSSSSY